MPGLQLADLTCGGLKVVALFGYKPRAHHPYSDASTQGCTVSHCTSTAPMQACTWGNADVPAAN